MARTTIEWFLLVVVMQTAWAQAAAFEVEVLPRESGVRQTAVLSGYVRVLLSPYAVANIEETQSRLGITIERPLVASLQKRTDATLIQREYMDIANVVDRLQRSVVARYSSPLPPERFAEKISGSCMYVEQAEPWYVYETTADSMADPDNTKQGLLRLLRIEEAWEISAGDSAVLIGISDSGVEIEHEDLATQIAINTNEIPANGIDDDNNGYPDDSHGYNFAWQLDKAKPYGVKHPSNAHGTAVAGIVGAAVRNGVGIAGVANRCRLVPLRTMPDNSQGIVFGYESMVYCAENNIPIVNCSWGGLQRSCFEADIVQYVLSKGTTIVASAGNHATTAPFYPASYRGVISVGVTDTADNIVDMSGYGASVDVMAPGNQSFSTWKENSYQGFCCTSGAAPIIAGIAGLVKAKRRLSVIEMHALFRESGIERPYPFLSNKEPELVPRNRVDAVEALQTAGVPVISIVVDTVEIRAMNGGARWTKGDTLVITASMRNYGVPVAITGVSNVQALGTNSALRVLASSIINTQVIPTGSTVKAVQVIAEVIRRTDTVAHIVGTLETTVDSAMPGAGKQTVQVQVVPSPAYRIVQNNVVRTALGDAARIGNVDLQQGIAEGFTFKGYCGQLYESGLMITANGVVVDAVRAGRRINNHFTPKQRFEHPTPFTAVVTDSLLADTMRVGVEVSIDASFTSDDTARIVLDITLRNTSGKPLADCAIGWFNDWDIGSSAGTNRVRQIDSSTQVVEPTLPNEPVALSKATSLYSDAVPVTVGIDNTTTYSTFSMDRKRQLLLGQEPSYDGTNDVATVSGIRFMQPIGPGQQRTCRFVFAMASTTEAALEHVAQTQRAIGSQAQLWVYPNPTSQFVTVAYRGTDASVVVAEIYNAIGQRVHSERGAGASIIWNFSTAGLPAGSYTVRVGERISQLILLR
jgi:hypothetical protein